MRRPAHPWGRSVVVLGFWEAVAMLTPVPTISRSVWWFTRRHPLIARALLGLWLAGLARHLGKLPPA